MPGLLQLELEMMSLLLLLRGAGRPHHVVGQRGWRGQRGCGRGCGRGSGRLGLQLEVLGEGVAVDVAALRFVATILEPDLHLCRRQIQLLGDDFTLRAR